MISKIFIGFAVFYAILVFIFPINAAAQAKLGLTNEQYYGLMFAVKLPIVIIYCVLFYAYRRVHSYTRSLGDTAEAAHFATITRGLMVIVWGLLLSGILASFLVALSNKYESLASFSSIALNYFYAITVLVGFSYISAGAHRLSRDAKLQFTTQQVRTIVMLLVALSVAFCYLIANRLSGDALSSFNAYYLPNVLVWLTVVSPNLYAWCLGILATFQLIVIARSAPGIIYRHALQYVALGLGGIIIALVMLQYFRTLVPRTGTLNPGLTLALTYIVYTISAGSALIMAFGAKRLRQIEEV